MSSAARYDASGDQRDMENTRLYIGVDVGTSNSGYTFAIGRHSDRYVCYGGKTDGSKVPTILLLNNDQEKSFHSFGKTAWDNYQGLEESEKKHYYLFVRFKMALHRDKNVHANMMIQASNRGDTLPAQLLFTRTLEFFNREASRQISLSIQGGERLAANEVTWILTVPAIWGDRARQFMRDAAKQAGMCPSNSKHEIVIELEPEGAALACREKLMHAWQDFSKPDILRYMVVDCGGGTVDIALHDLDMTTKVLMVKEVHQPTGGAWGGRVVDSAIVSFFKCLVGDRVASSLPNRIWTDLVFDSIEEAKLSIRDDSEYVFFENLFVFCYALEQRGVSLAELVKEKTGVKFIRGRLRVEVKHIKQCFQESHNSIEQEIRKVLVKAGGVRCILLVGGYCDSPFLVKRIQEKFGDHDYTQGNDLRCRIIKPDNCGQAVLKGAVMYGQNPQLIQMRLSRYAYGFDTTIRYDSEVHDPRRMVRVDRCRPMQVQHFFSKFIKVGQPMMTYYEKKFLPQLEDQKDITLRLYRSASNDVEFTQPVYTPPAPPQSSMENLHSESSGDQGSSNDSSADAFIERNSSAGLDEDACEELMEITVPLHTPSGSCKRHRTAAITIRLDFSDTLIHVTAKDSQGGDELNFTAEYTPVVDISTPFIPI